MIDVSQFSVDHQRAKAFVIGIEQLVIDYFGQHLPGLGDLLELVQFRQGEHRRFFDQDVFSGLEGQASGVEVPFVGRCDAHEIDTAVE